MLLYVCILAGIHFVEMFVTGQLAMPLAEAGGGGGYIGALVSGMLESVLGIGGAAIALAALILVSLALSFDITVMEMGRWVQEQYMRLLDWAGDQVDEFQSRGSAKKAGPAFGPAAGPDDPAEHMPEFPPAAAHPGPGGPVQPAVPGVVIGRPATNPGAEHRPGSCRRSSRSWTKAARSIMTTKSTCSAPA